MLHQTIRNEYFQRNTESQHFCDIVSNGYNTLFLYISLPFFARLQRETSRNVLVTRFMEKRSQMFLFTVSTAAHFFLGGRQHFSFSHRRYKFMLFFQQKMAPYISLFIYVAIFPVELRWPVEYFLFFRCLSLSLYSKFMDMTINLSLTLQTTPIQKQFPLSVFVFIDSLVVSASPDAGGYAISHQNNIELHLGCHTC